MAKTLAFLLLFTFTAMPVSAHPGRTDGDGGHYDHSDGEYHYHHGQPAHQHYDIDGDGNIDCPYKFIDNTNHNSKNDSSVNSISSEKKESKNSDADNNPKDTQSISTSYVPTLDLYQESEEKTFLDQYGWIIGLIICFGYPVFSLIVFCIESIIDTIRVRASNKRILNELGINKLKIPKTIVLLPNRTASFGSPDSTHPYGKYTVYLTKSGKVFHTKPTCCQNVIASHIFEIPEKLTPCRKCARNVQYPIITPSWYSEIKKKQK